MELKQKIVLPSIVRPLTIHHPGCRSKCRTIALSYLQQYLDLATYQEIQDACIRPETPFPEKWWDLWSGPDWYPSPVGTIEVWFGDSDGFTFTYPTQILND